jgi:hypothetical protein
VNKRCANFCDLPTTTSAAPDDAHGPWCVSPPVGREVGAQTETGPVEITIDRVRLGVERGGPSWIRLGADPAGNATSASVALRLTTGAARRLAATLVYAADLGDELVSNGSIAATG